MQDGERSMRPLDRMVWVAARAQDVRLVADEVDDICEAVIRGVWGAVSAAREDREALVRAQFAGLRGQLARQRATAVHRAWWTRDACEARAAELRDRLPALRERDGHLDMAEAA